MPHCLVFQSGVDFGLQSPQLDQMSTAIPHITDPSLIHSGTTHGFFGRQGGISTGIFDSLNCGLGSKDERSFVLENRTRLKSAIAGPDAPLVTPYQIHSSKCVAVDGAWPDNQPQHCDALATATPNLVIAIGTADCGPVLFSDPQNRVIGAAHSGWKGAIDGVLEETINAMESLGAKRENIRAALGPTISQQSYEVGEEFRQKFVDRDNNYAEYFVAGNRAAHFQFDLPGFIVNRLNKLGLAKAGWTGQCTYLNEAEFFSYRRTTHRQEPDYGRQLAAITLT